MSQISINKDKCIGCAKCATLCPAGVFTITTTTDKEDKNIKKAEVIAENNCINCSHCVAVCPTEAITHSEFPEGSLVDINFDIYPKPEQLLEIIKGRRSNRSFTKKAVEQDKLDLILDAAMASPTASNSQSVECTVISDAETLRKISEFAVAQYTKVVSMLENPFLKPLLKLIKKDLYHRIPAFKAMKEEWDNGKDPILRGATSLIFFHAPKKSHFRSADSNIAYQNASLVAESISITHFYTGLLCAAIWNDKQKEINKILNIKGEIQAGMALGNRAFPITRRRK